MVQDRYVVTTHQCHMAYLFVPFPMTLNDPEDHSHNAGLIKCNSTNFCATFSMVLTDTALCAISRRQLSFLWNFILALYVILWWLKMF